MFLVEFVLECALEGAFETMAFWQGGAATQTFDEPPTGTYRIVNKPNPCPRLR